MSLDERLREFVGRPIAPTKTAQDPVNLPMIRHWVEAMGDTNPIYLSEEAAKATGRPGVVAPASMTQAWTMRGYAATVDPHEPPQELADVLADAGYTSVVATDSDFEFERELRPGDLVSVDEHVESISPEKTTALGVGRFVTTLRTYRDADGEVVATQRWRLLRFRPAPRPVPRPRPAVNLDNQFWFAAARDRRLVIQRCTGCAETRHPPGPCCPACGSFEWDTLEASGRATLHSYVVAHHPRHPAFDYPHIVALVDLAEGTRLVTNLVGVDPDAVVIGMSLDLDWLVADADVTLPVFRPAQER